MFASVSLSRLIVKCKSLKLDSQKVVGCVNFFSHSTLSTLDMSVHTDEVLFDPLPQPFRFLNKIILKCIEEAIDLSEGGGLTETRTGFVSHNLKLTKVGTIPTLQSDRYFLSTQIEDQEIAIYQLLGNSQYLVAGTVVGDIIVFDLVEMKQVYVLNVTTLSKFAQQSPVTHLKCFESDQQHYVVAFATEDVGYILMLSPSFVLRTSVEIDVSQFVFETLTISNCTQGPYVVVTDGTGRTLVYNCHTPPEIAALENATTPSKGSSTKQVQLELILDIEKCPIGTGPVTSEAQLTQKQEETGSKKRVVKKKPAAPAKGRGRAKSPGNVTVENAQPAEAARNHAFVNVFGQVAVVGFGSFPMLLIYSTQTPNAILSEFPLPSAVTATFPLTEDNQLVVGFENGSFCLLNVARKSLHDHQFPKQGPISQFLMEGGILYAFTSTKVITGYNIDNCHINEMVYRCSDDSIISCHTTEDVILTCNQKSSEVNLAQALTKKTMWEEREFQMFPNVSLLRATNGRYIGSVSTPTNLEVVQSMCNRNYLVVAYSDPVEYRQPLANRVTSSHGRRSQKGRQPNSAKKPIKNAKSPKKPDDAPEEPEPTVVVKRHIISVLNLPDMLENFRTTLALMEKEKQRKRALLKSLSGHPMAEPVPEEPDPIPDEPNPSILCEPEE